MKLAIDKIAAFDQLQWRVTSADNDPKEIDI